MDMTGNSTTTDKNVDVFRAKEPVMVCKLRLNHNLPQENSQEGMHSLRFGAVWEPKIEGAPMTENAIFGKFTPYAEFSASVCNQAVLKNLKSGKSYIVTFTEADEQ